MAKQAYRDLTDTEELQHEIKRIARQKNAVILAHNYERPEVQDVADFVGDSLGLSREAAKTDAEIIVFRRPSRVHVVHAVTEEDGPAA